MRLLLDVYLWLLRLWFVWVIVCWLFGFWCLLDIGCYCGLVVRLACCVLVFFTWCGLLHFIVLWIVDCGCELFIYWLLLLVGLVWLIVAATVEFRLLLKLVVLWIVVLVFIWLDTWIYLSWFVILVCLRGSSGWLMFGLCLCLLC